MNNYGCLNFSKPFVLMSLSKSKTILKAAALASSALLPHATRKAARVGAMKAVNAAGRYALGRAYIKTSATALTILSGPVGWLVKAADLAYTGYKVYNYFKRPDQDEPPAPDEPPPYQPDECTQHHRDEHTQNQHEE